MPTTSEIIREVWRIEDRPEMYRTESFINSMSVDTVLALKKCWEETLKKENKGEDSIGQDAPLPTRMFDAGPDNCADLLHNAR